MKTITFSAIKGGVGKTSIAILLANYLSSTGKRVLCIDLDLQDALSFYYGATVEDTERHNIAKALTNDNLKENIVNTDLFVDIIPAAFSIMKLRALPERTLMRLLPQVEDEYDYCIIDCAPTYDNLVLNAINAADQVITPVNLTLFDYKSAMFYRDQIDLETDKVDSWKIMFNKYTEPKSDNPETELNQYIDLFEEEFSGRIMGTKIPKSTLVGKAIDTRIAITRSTNKRKVYDAIASLAVEVTEKPELTVNIGRF